jgi:pimeloyl-ACP methyl ester carboxylesterase
VISSVQAETLRREVRHSQLVVVEQCGHLINLEQPEELNKVVTAFLKQIESCRTD